MVEYYLLNKEFLSLLLYVWCPCANLDFVCFLFPRSSLLALVYYPLSFGSDHHHVEVVRLLSLEDSTMKLFFHGTFIRDYFKFLAVFLIFQLVQLRDLCRIFTDILGLQHHYGLRVSSLEARGFTFYDGARLWWCCRFAGSQVLGRGLIYNRDWRFDAN